MKYIFSLILLGGLSGGSVPAKADIPTVAHVDLQKYLGKWYEVASIPQSFQKQCVGNSTAEYSWAENELIRVLNSCDTAKGTRSVAEGRARVEDPASNAKLKVTFVKLIDWVFALGGKYWILDLAPDYSYALVGEPRLKYAWVLSRSPQVGVDLYRTAEQKLRSLGYDTCTVLTSVQTGGTRERRPLCEVVKETP